MCARINASPPTPISAPFSAHLIQVLGGGLCNINFIMEVGGVDASVRGPLGRSEYAM